MRTSWWWSLAVLVAVAALSYALYVYLRPVSLPAGILYGNGRIEATEIRIASDISGRVVLSNIVEAQTFKKGDLLLQVDDTDLELRLAQARADRLALSESRGKMLAAVKVAGHHSHTAETNVGRYRALASAGAVSQQERDVAENSLSEEQGLLQGSRSAVAQIDAQIASADQAIARLQNQIAKSHIVAPRDGTILLKMIESGEVIASGQPLAVIADLSRLELKIYVPESDLGRVKLRDPARVATDALPGNFAEATVERIDSQAQFTPRDIHMPEERTRTVFGVTLVVLNLHGELKPGMPADAWVKWRDEVPWPARLVVPQ
jgi:HlyD family secretion protein